MSETGVSQRPMAHCGDGGRQTCDSDPPVAATVRIDPRGVGTGGEARLRHAADSGLMRALRNRRRYVAALIDETIREQADAPRVLALGADHPRAVLPSGTIADAFAGETVADQDEPYLAAVQCAWARRGARLFRASADFLAQGLPDPSGFDLIYAGNAFDRPAPPLAGALCERAFAMLNPGGRMLIADVVPDALPESGMDWHRVYRDRPDMLVLIAGIARDRIAGIDLSSDDTGHLACLLVRRQAAGSASREKRLRQSRVACRNEWLRRGIRRP